MWQTVLEALPGGRCYSDVIGVVNAPVGAGKDLLWLIRINDDGVHRNIRKISSLVRPGERAAIGRACYLEHVTRRRRRVSVKAANTRVADRQRCRCHGRIQRDAHHRAIGQDSVVPSNIYPVSLARDAGAEIKTDPCVSVVGANNGNALVLRRVLDLIDKRTVAQRLFGHVLGGRIVRYVPV